MSTADIEPAEGRVRRTRWDDVLDWSGSVRAVAVMRIAIGPITLLHLRPFLRDAVAGVSYDDHFWQPFISWLPELPAGVWFALLWVGAAAAVLMTIGLWTRFATVTAFAVVAPRGTFSHFSWRVSQDRGGLHGWNGPAVAAYLPLSNRGCIATNKTKGAAVSTAARQDLHASAEVSDDIGSFYMPPTC